MITLLPRSRLGRIAIWLIGAALLLVATTGIYFRLTRGPIAFDKTIWLAETTRSPHNRRQRMADGLLSEGKLIGLDSTQVEALLGPRPQTEYFRDYDYAYWLGTERGFIGIDSE